MSDGLLGVLLIIVIGLWCEYPIWGPMIRRKRMLTESEKKWLADNEKWNFKLDVYGNACFCPSCKHCEYFTETVCQDAEDIWLYDKLSKCPLVPSKELLLEAAEFETRVAAKLAGIFNGIEQCLNCKNAHMFDNHSLCPSCKLKWARLQVEEEING